MLVSNVIVAEYSMLLNIVVDIYTFFLLFTLTGFVAERAGVADNISVGETVPPAEGVRAEPADKEREKALSHAYGFISRGNREGGLKHIRESIKLDPDPHAAVSWYFNEMMNWESRDAALFFAQDCFAHYLHHDMDAEALKLMATCVHQDPRWRPKPENLQHAVELAERYGREDLQKSLNG